MTTERTHWADCWREPTHHACALARIAELVAAQEKALQMLEVYGVPRARARSVANGIDALMSRIGVETLAASARIAELEAAAQVDKTPNPQGRPVDNTADLQARIAELEAERDDIAASCASSWNAFVRVVKERDAAIRRAEALASLLDPAIVMLTDAAIAKEGGR